MNHLDEIKTVMEKYNASRMTGNFGKTSYSCFTKYFLILYLLQIPNYIILV